MATCGNTNAKKVVKSMKEDWKFEDLILVDDIEKSFVVKNEEGEDDDEDSSNAT